MDCRNIWNFFSLWILDQILNRHYVAIAHTPVFAWNLVFHLMPTHLKYCIPAVLSLLFFINQK